MLSDPELLALLNTNPETGIKKLTRLYGGLVYTIVRGRLCGLLSEQDVEECASDVLYEVYKKRESVDLQNGTLKGFLALTAKRRAIDRCRKAQSRGFSVSLDDGDTPQPQSEENPEQAAELAQLKSALVREITALGYPDSEILIRRYYYNQRSQEIAKALHMKENTVDQRIRRSIQKLREQKQLQRHFGGELSE